MENLKIHVRTETQSRVAQNLLFELGYVWVDSQDQLQMKFVEPCWYSAFEDGDLCRDVLDVNQNHREVDTFELSRMVLKKHNLDAVASPNDIAKTAEVHRQAVKAIESTDGSSLFVGQMAYRNAKTNADKLNEHNLSNKLNDLCAEFGCPPGADRMGWMRKQLRKAQSHEDGFTTYQYAASINTARGTIQYDGVINLLGRITDIDDYQQARAEIAKDGNVAPDQVNVHSLSIVG